MGTVRTYHDTLLLMPCSKTKLDWPAVAHKLYTGPMWQTLKTHIGALPWRNVIVLSARFGFIYSQQFIQTYNERLTAEKADELIAGGIDGTRDRAGAGPSLRTMIEHDRRRRPFSHVIIAGAGEYRRVFEAVVRELRDAGMIDAGARVDQVAGGIGEQRKQLGQWLREVGAQVEPKAPASYVTCQRERCTRTWPRDPVLEVECPTCHASIGARCKRPSGHGVFGGDPHDARDILAWRKGHYGACPTGRCGAKLAKRFGTAPEPEQTFGTELTPIGEQFVIPGCEKRDPPAKPSQLDLWSGRK